MQFKGNLVILLVLTFNLFSGSLTNSTGNIRTPDANFNLEGVASIIYADYDPFQHIRITMAPYDWFEGSFFYTDINTERYAGTVLNQSNKDKGFSFKFKLKSEGNYPAIAIGFEDLAGTALFSSEYIVATKNINKFEISAGIGWGSLGTLNNFKNPLLLISEEYKDRVSFSQNLGGTPDLKTYFRGDSSLFGGVKYLLDKKSNFLLKLEYDSNNFNYQRGYNAKESTRYNYGFSFKPSNSLEVGVYRTEGNDLSVNFIWEYNFSKSRTIRLSKNKKIKHKDDNELYSHLLDDGFKNYVLLQNAKIDEGKNLKIKYIQTAINNEKQFANTYANKLYSELENIEKLHLIPANGSISSKTYSYKKGTLIDISKSLNSPKETFDFNPNIEYPINSINFTPDIITHFGSPAGFIFADLAARLNFNSIISEGFEFDASYKFSLLNNYENFDYNPAYTDVYPVRVDIQNYLKEGKNSFDRMHLSKLTQLSANDYILVTLGHLERMFSGVHFDYLHEFNNKYFKAGFDAAYVIQREFTQELFSFRDYEVFTSHINLNAYEPFFDIYLDVSIGKYLAKDKGLTVKISKVFKNGLEMGGFFTKTNLSPEQFGEGSFDKGIFFSYPLNIFSSKYTKGSSGFTYRPLTRDGGAKLYMYKTLTNILREPSLVN